MAAVVFAFGNRPGIDEHDARDLAELLGRERNLAAQGAALKIKTEASVDPDKGEVSRDVVLEPAEMQVLLQLLRTPSPLDSDAVWHLRDELEAVLGVAPRGVRFLTPEVTTDVADNELRFLRAELRMIAATQPPHHDVAGLLERLDANTVTLTEGAATFQADDRDRALLLRATDHLRNLGHRGALLTLRDRLIDTGAARWIAYELTFGDGRPAQDFTSYSLAYMVPDRLVTGAGDELVVTRVVDDESDPRRLAVEQRSAG